jgi:hypothetical protein
MKINKNEVILHGECMVFLSKLPSDAKKKSINNNFVIVAPSETTGNHHVVDVHPGVDFFEGINGTLYMQNSVDTVIRCVIESRHTEIVLPAGNTYEFGSQMEYDPFAARLQKVRD